MRARRRPSRRLIDTRRRIRDAFGHGRTGERRMTEASSPSGDRVSVEISGGVAEGRLDRPGKINALDAAMFAALIDAGERLRRTPRLRVVVLHGAGRGFCAGL